MTTDLTPGGELLGVLGASDDASRIYYPTTAGLFLRNGATTTPIASGPSAGRALQLPPGHRHAPGSPPTAPASPSSRPPN